MKLLADGASREGMIIHIVPLDPAYKVEPAVPVPVGIADYQIRIKD